jgi:hypothetical protein
MSFLQGKRSNVAGVDELFIERWTGDPEYILTDTPPQINTGLRTVDDIDFNHVFTFDIDWTEIDEFDESAFYFNENSKEKNSVYIHFYKMLSNAYTDYLFGIKSGDVAHTDGNGDVATVKLDAELQTIYSFIINWLFLFCARTEKRSNSTKIWAEFKEKFMPNERDSAYIRYPNSTFADIVHTFKPSSKLTKEIQSQSSSSKTKNLREITTRLRDAFNSFTGLLPFIDSNFKHISKMRIVGIKDPIPCPESPNPNKQTTSKIKTISTSKLILSGSPKFLIQIAPIQRKEFTYWQADDGIAKIVKDHIANYLNPLDGMTKLELKTSINEGGFTISPTKAINNYDILGGVGIETDNCDVFANISDFIITTCERENGTRFYSIKSFTSSRIRFNFENDIELHTYLMGERQPVN